MLRALGRLAADTLIGVVAAIITRRKRVPRTVLEAEQQVYSEADRRQQAEWEKKKQTPPNERDK